MWMLPAPLHFAGVISKRDRISERSSPSSAHFSYTGTHRCWLTEHSFTKCCNRQRPLWVNTTTPLQPPWGCTIWSTQGASPCSCLPTILTADKSSKTRLTLSIDSTEKRSKCWLASTHGIAASVSVCCHFSSSSSSSTLIPPVAWVMGPTDVKGNCSRRFQNVPCWPDKPV